MEYLIKASAVIALLYLCFFFFLKKETFFQHNRWFLLTGLLLALVFPLVVIPVYIPIEPIALQETGFMQSTASNFVPARTETIFDWTSLLSIIYIIGVIVFLIQFILQFGSLALLLLKNPKQKDEHFTYVIVESAISPFSFFKWIVYNPESYKDKELQLILTHEKVHVTQLHSIDILLTQLACIVFWFNPLIWLYRKEVRQNLEYIADAKTQNSSRVKQEYQHLLLKTSVANHDTILSNNFYNSSIKKRIIMLNKSRSHRGNQFKYLLILPLLAGLLISMNTENVYVETETKINATISDVTNQTNHVEIIFTKEMTDKQLDDIKRELKSNAIDMAIKSLKRNKNNDITAINIDFKTNNGSSNYKANNKAGIKSFYFNKNEDGSFGVGSAPDNEVVVVETIDINTLQKNKNTSIYSEYDNNSLKVIVEDSTTVRPKRVTVINKKGEQNSKDSIFISIDSSEVQHLTKRKSDLYYEDAKTVTISKYNGEEIIIHQPEKAYKNISNYTSQNPKPLVVVEGKVASYATLKAINPNTIESLTVLKGEKAVNKYGEKGKNGVIELALNNGKSNSSKKASPWKISKVEVSSVTYVDDEDASKNGSIAYISKSTPDNVLETQKNELERIGITVKYSKLRRNKAGEITSIKISLEDGKGSKSSATWKVNHGIPNIEFGKSEGTLIARTTE